MARQHLKSPQSLSGTSAHPTMVTLVNIMVMNRWLTSSLFHVNWLSHSWDKAISDSDLEISTPTSRSWVWSKVKVIQSVQYHINSPRFHFTSIRPTIPKIELFRNLTLKQLRSRSWVRSKVKVTYCTQHLTDALHHFFHINRTNRSWDMAKTNVWPWKTTSKFFLRKFAKITVSNKTALNSYQVINIIRAIKLLCFVVIWWVVFILCAHKQIFANWCNSRDLGSRSPKVHPVHFPRL